MGGIADAQTTTPKPVAGENVNMVSGVRWPDGDPFLQRQNEPSLAVSSGNPFHLFAASNDYRTVDVPGLPSDVENGDAWIGIYRSIDGGQTWQSRLLPGYPQQNRVLPDAIGYPSVLQSYTPPGSTTTYSFTSASDANVRAGTDGLVFVSGLAFNRSTGARATFVARYLDDGSSRLWADTAQTVPKPFDYQDTKIVTFSPGVDWPSFAADIPRPVPGKGTPPQTCGLTGTPAGVLYQAYTNFSTTTNTSQVLVSTSSDCGNSWVLQPQLSSTQQLNQGATLAIDPVDGTVWVVWRRFAQGSQPDAIVIARSINQGQTFTPQQGVVIASGMTPFDNDSFPTQFRIETIPTIAISVDSAGNRRIHVAWSQGATAAGDARIVMMTSSAITPTTVTDPNWTSPAGKWTTIVTWSTPAPIDNPVNGAWSDTPSVPHALGDQFMPSLTFGQGRLMLAYYDSRFDYARRYLSSTTDASGNLVFNEQLGPTVALLNQSTALYDPTLLAQVFPALAMPDPSSYFYLDLVTGQITLSPPPGDATRDRLSERSPVGPASHLRGPSRQRTHHRDRRAPGDRHAGQPAVHERPRLPLPVGRRVARGDGSGDGSGERAAPDGRSELRRNSADAHLELDGPGEREGDPARAIAGELREPAHLPGRHRAVRGRLHRDRRPRLPP